MDLRQNPKAHPLSGARRHLDTGERRENKGLTFRFYLEINFKNSYMPWQVKPGYGVSYHLNIFPFCLPACPLISTFSICFHLSPAPGKKKFRPGHISQNRDVVLSHLHSTVRTLLKHNIVTIFYLVFHFVSSCCQSNDFPVIPATVKVYWVLPYSSCPFTNLEPQSFSLTFS